MADNASWRTFRSMQRIMALSASLIYGLCAIDAWAFMRGPPGLKLQSILWLPGAVFVLCLLAFLLIPPLKSALRQHLLTSYRAGFGQTVISVLSGVAAPILIAAFVLWQIHYGARPPASEFAAFAAGLGILVAQAILLRGLEP